MFVIKSSLDSTDCSGCRIYKKDTTLFAKRVQQPNLAVLPLKIAEMPNVAAAEAALERIRFAIITGKTHVDLTDLE